MRSFVFRRTFAFGSLVLLPLFACVNSSDSPPGPQGFDGGNNDFDAHVGSDGSVDSGTLPDSTVPDGDLPDVRPLPDAADAAAAFASVTVIGLDGKPKAGVTVVFSDDTGATVDVQQTDATGHVQRVVAGTNMVTVGLGGDGLRELVTYVGIKNGDAILALDVGEVPPSPTLSVTTPANPPVGSSPPEVLVGDCFGNGQSPITVYLNPACFSKGTAPVVAIVRDDGNNPSAFAFGKSFSVASDAGAVVPVSGLSAWTQPFGSFTVVATKVDPSTQSVAISNAEIASGVPYHQNDRVAPVNDTAQASFRTMPGYADRFQPQVGLRGPSQSAETLSVLAANIAGNTAGPQSFDVSGALPWFDTLDVDTTTPARPKVTWTFTASPTGMDGGYVRGFWFVQTDAGSEQRGWTFVYPAGTTSVQGPILPAQLASWQPVLANDFEQAIAGIVDQSDIPDYRALLTRTPALLGINGQGSIFSYPPVLPDNTTVRLSVLFPPG